MIMMRLSLIRFLESFNDMRWRIKRQSRPPKECQMPSCQILLVQAREWLSKPQMKMSTTIKASQDQTKLARAKKWLLSYPQVKKRVQMMKIKMLPCSSRASKESSRVATSLGGTLVTNKREETRRGHAMSVARLDIS